MCRRTAKEQEQEQHQSDTAGLLDRLYSLRIADELDWLRIVSHRGIYVLPLWYSSQPQHRIVTPKQQSFSLRDNPRRRKGAIQLGYAYRLGGKAASVRPLAQRLRSQPAGVQPQKPRIRRGVDV